MRARTTLGAGVRTAVAVLTTLALGAGLVGCGRAEANPVKSARPSPAQTRWPVGLEGGACQLLDYDTVAHTTGTEFEVAAAADKDGTYTCVLQRRDASYPDLTLAVTATTIGVPVYRSVVVPAKASSVPGLGLAGYRVVSPPLDGAGTAVEVGWLAGNGRMLMIRYRASPTGGADQTSLVDGVTALAKTIDIASV
jgi:hypothetical protein